MDETGAPADRIARDRLWRLPNGTKQDGTPRCIGVEIEFAGLTERDAAGLVETLWGGSIAQDSPHAIQVRQTRLGTVKIELDTALKDKSNSRIADRLLDLSREVVPVEIVMPPLPEDDLPEIERLIVELHAAGALGSEDGVSAGIRNSLQSGNRWRNTGGHRSGRAVLRLSGTVDACIGPAEPGAADIAVHRPMAARLRRPMRRRGPGLAAG